MKCALYIRVSTERREQEESLENQKKIFEQFIKERGWEVYKIYADVKTGTRNKREQFKQMVADAENKKFDFIIAKELSRIARNAELSYRLKRLCEENGMGIITLDGLVDTTDETKKSTFGLYAWLYEQESQNISNRIKSVFKAKYRAGECLDSTPTYGYERIDKKLHIRNDETVEVVKLIFEKYISGWGYDKIARYLSKERYKTPSQILGKTNAGIYWHGTTIKKILKNKAYIGNLVRHKETSKSVTISKREKVSEEKMIEVENTHEGIISREQFEMVQELIQSRKAEGRGKVKEKKHLFTNVIYCADCGKHLWYRQNRKGYICGSYAKHGKIACSNHAVKEDKLKEIVLSDLREFTKHIDRDKFIMKLKDRLEKNEKQTLRRLKNIDEKVKVLKNRKSNLLDKLLDGTIDEEIYKHKEIEIQEEIERLEVEKNEIENDTGKIDGGKLKTLEIQLLKIIELEELTDSIVNQLIEKIEVEEDRSIIIHYRFKEEIEMLKEIAK